MSSESRLAVTEPVDSDLARMSVAAVARRLGIAPGTLRTWDRRYGLGPTEHCVGEHRKYSAKDLARLRYMHKLVISGVTPAEAARIAVAHDGAFSEELPIATLSIDGQLVKTLFRAAEVLDRRLLESLMRDYLDAHGVEATWVNVLVPLLCIIGDKWERTGESIATEHMVTDVIKKLFAERVDVKAPINEVPILLACVGEETHSLAISALAAALAEVNISVQFLGARTPSPAINEVIRRFTPAAIFLWAQLPANASPQTVAALPAVRPAPRVILGGPGWAGVDCPGVFVVSDLTQARQEIMYALGL